MFEPRENDRLPTARRVSPDAHRHRARLGGAALVSLGVGALIGTIAHPPKVRLLWNASASAPIGLYLVAPDAPLEVGDMVAAWPPEGARQLAAMRRYLPSGVPLVKRVAATKGSQVCALEARITADGRTVARRRKQDAHGRPMPWWSGCRRLHHGQVLLLNRAAASFDSRYFGPVEQAAILGKAVLIWQR